MFVLSQKSNPNEVCVDKMIFSGLWVLLDLHCLPVGVYDADVDDDNDMHYQYCGVSLGNYWVLYHISAEAPECVREITGCGYIRGCSTYSYLCTTVDYIMEGFVYR